jgi:hypothetical protein
VRDRRYCREDKEENIKRGGKKDIKRSRKKVNDVLVEENSILN